MAKSLKISDRVKVFLAEDRTELATVMQSPARKFPPELGWYKNSVRVEYDVDYGYPVLVPVQWCIKLKPKKKRSRIWIKTDGALSVMDYRLEQNVKLLKPADTNGWIEFVEKRIKK